MNIMCILGNTLKEDKHLKIFSLLTITLILCNTKYYKQKAKKKSENKYTTMKVGKIDTISKQNSSDSIKNDKGIRTR